MTHASQKARELVHIGGDVPDPVFGTGKRGIQSTVDFEKTALGHPEIRYTARDGTAYVITADVYKQEGSPLEVLLFCPLCSKKGDMHTLKIREDRKKIEYDEERVVLSIAAFKCTWHGAHGACQWAVEIDENVARDV